MLIKGIKTYGPLYIVVAAFLWAVDGVIRRSLFVLSPSVIVFYEHLIGALLILPFTVVAFDKEKAQINRQTVGALVWVALLSGVIGTLFFTAALIKVYFISFSVVYLLQKLQPVFAILAARIVLKEKITPAYAKWAVLALLAAYFVTFKNGYVDYKTGSDSINAALLAVGAAFAWGSSTAFSRYGLLNLSNTLMTGLRFWITVPLALLTVFILGQGSGLATIQADQIVRLIIIGLSTGMVALLIYYQGLKYTQVKIATFLELIFPLTAVFIDLFYYHNALALSQYLAAAILLFAVYQISLLNNKDKA